MNHPRHVRLRLAIGVALTVVLLVVGFLDSNGHGSARAVPRPTTQRAAAHPGATRQLLAAPVRPVHPARRPIPSPCAAHRDPRIVMVSIEQQRAWACSHGRTRWQTPVTTGASHKRGDATPRGRFFVLGRIRNTTLSTDGHRYHVKYWVPFRVGVWGFHDASWQTIPFGSHQYVEHGSHGCVHMPLPAIRRLFRFVRYGTPVVIS